MLIRNYVQQLKKEFKNYSGADLINCLLYTSLSGAGENDQTPARAGLYGNAVDDGGG